MIVKVPLNAGTFFSFHHGYAIFCKDISAGLEVELGAQYSLGTMLSMWDLQHDDEHVGFFFYSPFKVENKGASLVAFMESKRGKATKSKLMVRHDSVMVFELEGCGAMALSTKVSPEMESILEEQ